MRRQIALLWFLIGLGSRLQVVASLSISEIILLVAGPILLVQNFERMRRDGIMTYFWLSLLVVLGCVVGSLYNHTSPAAILRGLAVTCLVTLSVPVCHWLIRKDAAGFKWYLVGGAISGVLSTFWLQSAYDLNVYGADSEAIMSGPIYWVGQVATFSTLPSRGWYLHVPIWASVGLPLFSAFFAMKTSTSGRSAALGAIASAAICIIGRKRRASMRIISKYFWLMALLAVGGIFLAHAAYRTAALSGWLGEAAYQKYLSQSQGSNSIGRLLLGGRADAFTGLMAAVDQPIVGFGPWALDMKGYTAAFMRKFGTDEDARRLSKMVPGSSGYALIGCHSMFVEFWVWYGLMGLIYCLYCIFVLLRFLKQDCYVVPQWFMWLACSVPGLFWGIFFSPFANRLGFPLVIVACLMARAVRRGRFVLPLKMQIEIEKSEQRR